MVLFDWDTRRLSSLMHGSSSVDSDASDWSSSGESMIGVDIELDVIDAFIDGDADEPDMSPATIGAAKPPSAASSPAISSMTNCKLSSLGIDCDVVKKSWNICDLYSTECWPIKSSSRMTNSLRSVIMSASNRLKNVWLLSVGTVPLKCSDLWRFFTVFSSALMSLKRFHTVMHVNASGISTGNTCFCV